MRKVPTKPTALFLSFALLLAQFVFLPQLALAAPQQDNLGGTNNGGGLVFDTDDDPLLNDDPTTTATFGGLSVPSGAEGSAEQTTADSGVNQRYTWRMPDISERVCSNAQLTSLRVQADVTATSEGNPDLVSLSVYRIDGSDMYNIGGYTISQGSDIAPTTGFATPPNGLGVYGVGRGTPVELGGQIAGQIEATWDMSGFDVDDQFGVMIQQDSEDGTTDMQTTIQAVELNYDDENCIYDGAITKTLLNSESVTPGGQAIYEITLTNKGTEPLPFNGQEDRGVFDVPSASLQYQSVESADVDVQCQDAGTLGSLFGGDPQASLPYQNHLDYSMVLCSSQSSMLVQPGESVSFRLSFDVAADATNITNFVTWVLAFDNFADPDMAVLGAAATSLTPGGVDMIDLLLAGDITADIVNVVSYDFTTANQSSTDNALASSGGPLVQSVVLLSGILASAVLVARRHQTYKRI